ncbi:unnamed protein product [Absidia cylindrospora]
MIQKRHSIQPELQQLSKLTLDTNTNTSSNTNSDSSKQRHSYTFGKRQEMKKLSLKDLVLDASQEKKLDSLFSSTAGTSSGMWCQSTNDLGNILHSFTYCSSTIV